MKEFCTHMTTEEDLRKTIEITEILNAALGNREFSQGDIFNSLSLFLIHFARELGLPKPNFLSYISSNWEMMEQNMGCKEE